MWPLTNAALLNRHFASIDELEEAQLARCAALQKRPDLIQAIRSTTCFHWWPKRLHKRRGPRRRHQRDADPGASGPIARRLYARLILAGYTAVCPWSRAVGPSDGPRARQQMAAYCGDAPAVGRRESESCLGDARARQYRHHPRHLFARVAGYAATSCCSHGCSLTRLVVSSHAGLGGWCFGGRAGAFGGPGADSVAHRVQR
jgi:hypothetical protein